MAPEPSTLPHGLWGRGGAGVGAGPGVQGPPGDGAGRGPQHLPSTSPRAGARASWCCHVMPGSFLFLFFKEKLGISPFFWCVHETACNFRCWRLVCCCSSTLGGASKAPVRPEVARSRGLCPRRWGAAPEGDAGPAPHFLECRRSPGADAVSASVHTALESWCYAH